MIYSIKGWLIYSIISELGWKMRVLLILLKIDFSTVY